jgi:guanosine-3',5'-bis(diphosphate) 3'-pyrophosphohydrolase
MTILEFVTEKHKGQKRKYTEEPYVNHLIRVASNFEKDSYLYNLALCHDLFEDTDCTENELKEIYREVITKNNKGLNIQAEIVYFIWYVQQLTDRFTKTNYPELNRFYRKQLELKRLSELSSIPMTVKYADLIDNCDIVLYDKSFGKVYLQEKYEILKHCQQGDFDLYYKAVVKHNEMMKLL